MGFHEAPPAMRLQPHLMALAIDADDTYYYAAITRDSGMVVWKVGDEDENLLDRLPTKRQVERGKLWGNPVLTWRPSDGLLLISSVTPDESGVMTLPIPGVYFGGEP